MRVELYTGGEWDGKRDEVENEVEINVGISKCGGEKV